MRWRATSNPAVNLIDFLRASDHAALLHLSTCYVVGGARRPRDRRADANYTPADVADFDAEREWQSLQEMVRKVENARRVRKWKRRCAGRRWAGAASGRTAAGPRNRESDPQESHALDAQPAHARGHAAGARGSAGQTPTHSPRAWRNRCWPRAARACRSPLSRPSIVETSTDEPFCGWNEGINTSAPLSYLLGTYFRQLPSNERKCLDVIPVDMVCRGMTLIAAALVERRHQPIYQLATSANNPCNMGRSIELTALAHRKHYRAQQGLEHWLRMRFDSIPVSKERYRNLSVPAQKIVVQGINRAASALQFKRPPLARAERDLERVEKLIELYEPFILHNEQVFESRKRANAFRRAARGRARAFRLRSRRQSTGGTTGSTSTFRRCASGAIR